MYITAFYAAPIGLLAIGLALRVVLLRRRYQVGVGSGGEPELMRAVRAHGNLLEYTPLALLLLLLLESGGARDVLLHGIGSALLIGRLLHAWGLSRESGISFGRFYGTALTWAAMLVTALALLVRPLLA